MMYIENIFICMFIPLFLSVIIIQGDMRKYMLFICIGMGMCVLSAYQQFFYGVLSYRCGCGSDRDRTGL